MSSETARSQVLRRIRTALADEEQRACGEPVRPAELSSSRESALTREQVLALFEERLRDYDAEVQRAASGEVAEVVARMLHAQGLRRFVAPAGLEPAWLPDGAGIEVDQDFSARELDGFDGVITGATLGIAETGTLVLQTVAGQGRRALSLVPDVHLCIVSAGDIVADVPEAMTRLRATSSLPTTFVSGPSATADIEMTRIKGVHGPRFLHVVVVG